MKTFIGIVIGFLLSLFLMLGIESLRQKPTCEQMTQRFTAYRHCLQVAGAKACRMTPENFIHYYDLKAELEHCPAIVEK